MEKRLNTSNVSKSDLPLLPPEGFNHEHLYSILRIVQLVLLVIFFIIGAVGNLSVMGVVLRKRKKRKVKHYFMFHLAFADSLVVIVSLPIKVHDEYSETGYVPEYLWVLWTKILPPLVPFSVLLSIFTMVCMAWERHRAIVNPFKKPIMRSRILKMIIAQWLLAIVVVTPITYTARYEGEWLYHDWGSERNRQIYTLCQVLIQYVLPLGVILIYHIMIIRYVRHARQNISWLTRARESRKILRNNLKLYRKCLLTIVLFAIFIFPEMLFTLWTDFGNLGEFEHRRILGAVGNLFVIIESAVNPSIYANFDQILLKKWRRCFGTGTKKAINKKRPSSIWTSIKIQFSSIFSGSSGKSSSDGPNIELEKI